MTENLGSEDALQREARLKQMRAELMADMEASIKRGVEYLKTCPGPIEIILPEGAWNFCTMVSEDAKELGRVINESGGHSGSSLGHAIQTVVFQAPNLGLNLSITGIKGSKDRKVFLSKE